MYKLGDTVAVVLDEYAGLLSDPGVIVAWRVLRGELWYYVDQGWAASFVPAGAVVAA